MSLERIQAAIPHRPPMLLVDEVVEQTDDHIVCRKTFRADEFFFQGHYPGRPLVPGVILCESAMQAGAILLSRQLSEAAGVPVATRMNDVKFKRMVRPGETIAIDVKLDERVGSAFFLSAKVAVEGQAAVRFQFACTMTPVDATPASGTAP
jgi:3-hydroxyacyl-[acyl-carrier-protein] dehydratase